MGPIESVFEKVGILERMDNGPQSAVSFHKPRLRAVITIAVPAPVIALEAGTAML
jgi:hypothetical protein